MSEEIAVVSQIAEWYSGKSVFITGATGFIGKALIEKLLRSCPNIAAIYILLRGKRGVLPEDRLAPLLKEPLYDNIRKNNPENFKKIIVVKGDVMQPNLGICPEDRAELIQNVSVVFHSAATIKFNETIRIAVDMNVIGTREVMNMAHEMKNLQAFVHLSTAFSNCNRTDIEEKLYESPVELDKLLQMIKLLDDDTLNYLTPKLLKEWPNTYTWTKALAEQLVSAHAQSRCLPTVIVRPAIVTAAWQEPVPGWLDNINGPTGVILGGAKGIVRAIPAHSKNLQCFVPVDIVVNLTVSVAWHIACNKYTTVPIFNCSTETINPTHLGEFCDKFLKWFDVYPSDSAVWYPGFSCISHLPSYRIHKTVTRTIPALMFDLVLRIIGKKTFAVKLSSKIDVMIYTYQHFLLGQWKFHTTNIPKLLDTLSAHDKELFNFDVRSFSWNEYTKNYCLGIKQFLLKESLDNLPAARIRFQRLKIIYYMLYLLFILGFPLICFKFVNYKKYFNM